MTSIPPFEVLTDPPEETPKTDWRHNWLYSVLPITNRVKPNYGTAHIEEEDGLYLSGYCKTCQKAFTVKMPHDSKDSYVTVTQLDIPRWGCVDPQQAI